MRSVAAAVMNLWLGRWRGVDRFSPLRWWPDESMTLIVTGMWSYSENPKMGGYNFLTISEKLLRYAVALKCNGEINYFMKMGKR